MSLPSTPWWIEHFRFFAQSHASQKYKDGLPYWHHLYKVATVLETALDEGNEVDPAMKQAMIIAALGHDALEDTSLSADEIRVRCGPEVLGFIEGMTNAKGDSDTKDYVEGMACAPEEVRLIKMSDSIDNYHLMAYRVADNGAEWLHEKIVPLMEPMFRRIILTQFSKYPKTAALLKGRLVCAHDLGLRAVVVASDHANHSTP